MRILLMSHPERKISVQRTAIFVEIYSGLGHWKFRIGVSGENTKRHARGPQAGARICRQIRAAIVLWPTDLSKRGLATRAAQLQPVRWRFYRHSDGFVARVSQRP